MQTLTCKRSQRKRVRISEEHRDENNHQRAAQRVFIPAVHVDARAQVRLVAREIREDDKVCCRAQERKAARDAGKGHLAARLDGNFRVAPSPRWLRGYHVNLEFCDVARE